MRTASPLPRFSRLSPNPPPQIGGVRQLVRARLQTAGAIAADANTRVVLYFGGVELNEQNDAAIVEDSSVTFSAVIFCVHRFYDCLNAIVLCFVTQFLTLRCLCVFEPAALGGNATISVELQ
jgi:hypothetical protein